MKLNYNFRFPILVACKKHNKNSRKLTTTSQKINVGANTFISLKNLINPCDYGLRFNS